MSENPDNIDPKEATEAKLCAYLDGELSPPEREEIEKYLESNPQHRQLLSELARTRDFVRALPRESAPAEIGELFQERLERSLLLDGPEGGAGAPIGRINRLPQVLLIAAMVLLAAGLSVVIYFALPGRGPGPTQYSVATSAPGTPATGTPAPGAPTSSTATTPPATVSEDVLAKSAGPIEKSDAPPAAGIAAVDQSKMVPPLAATPAPVPTAVASAPPSDAAQPQRFDRAGNGEATESGRSRMGKAGERDFSFGDNTGGGGGAGGAGLVSVAANAQVGGALSNHTIDAPVDSKALNDRLARSNSTLQKLGADPRNMLCVVVSADDTDAAASQVRSYFVTNKIAYQPLPPDDLVAANTGNVALLKDTNKLGEFDVDVKKEPAVNAGNTGNAVASKGLYDKDYAQKIQPRYGTARDVQNAQSNVGWGQSQNQAPTTAAGQAADNLRQQQQNFATNYGGALNDEALKKSVGNANMAAANTNDNAPTQEPIAQQSQAKPVPAQQGALLDAFAQKELAANANASQQINASVPATTAIDGSDAFIATGLTRREAEQLSATLSTRQLGQTASIVTPEDLENRKLGTDSSYNFGVPAGGVAIVNGSTTVPSQQTLLAYKNAPATTGPSTSPSLFAASGKVEGIQPQDRLTVTVAQLVGPGVDKTNTVKVAGDGTISLPMIEPVRAVGQTPAELEKQIGDKYREANLIPDASVTVAWAAAAATTAPTTMASTDGPTTASALTSASASVITTQPSTRPLAAEQTTLGFSSTQPAQAAEKVDVIVLVQRNSITANAPGAVQPNAAVPVTPATQPSLAK